MCYTLSMAHRLSAAQWSNLKELFPAQIPTLRAITIELSSGIITDYWKRIKKKKIKVIDENLVETLLCWLFENCSGQFYAEFKRNGYSIQGITVFFFEEDDAILFKLTWWGCAQ
jgi:hypothetical protein